MKALAASCFVLLIAGSSVVFGWGPDPGASKPAEKKTEPAPAKTQDDKSTQTQTQTQAVVDETGEVVIIDVKPVSKNTTTIPTPLGMEQQTEKRVEEYNKIKERYYGEKDKQAAAEQDEKNKQQQPQQQQPPQEP
jgi:hypothetical protein